jgi:outer membrane cobalamin receptor
MTRHTIGRRATVTLATRRRTAAWFAVLVGVLLWPRATSGQNLPHDLGDMTLEELLNLHVTTATKSSERSMTVPAHVEVVTSETIRARGYRSLLDVLRDLPDFKVDVATDPDLPTDVTVQGRRGSNRLIVLLDGIRVSSPTNEPLPILANYPVHAARQIEIVYGPGSALYGADAFSGVVNIITRSAAEAPGLTVSASSGQFGLSNATGSYSVRLNDHLSLLVAGQGYFDRQPDLTRYYPDFGGLTGQKSGTFETIFGPMTPATPVPSAYNIPLSAHSMQAVVEAGPVRFSLFESRERMSTATPTTPDNGIYSDEGFNENHLLVGAVSHSKTFGRLTSVSTVMMSRQELDPQSGYRNVYSNMERSYKYAYGSRLSGEQQVSWKQNARMTVTAGGVFDRLFSIPQTADLNAPIKSRDQPGTILGTTIADPFDKIHYSNLGLYGQGQVMLTSTLTATLGLRFDDSTRYEDAVTPRVGFVWQPGPKTTVKLLHGTAFLAPSPYQAYAHYGSFYSTDGGQTYASSYWHLPNPDLQPERRRTEELDVQHGLGERVSVWSSLFYSRFQNLVREGQDHVDRYAGFFHGWPVDFIEISINDGRENMWGGSAGVKTVTELGSNRRIVADVSVSLVNGTVTSSDAAVKRESSGLTPFQMHASAEMSGGKWSVAPRLLVVGNQRSFALRGIEDGIERRRTVPGYATVDVNVRREQLLKGLDVFLTIENAFDARYRHLNLRAYSNPEELIGAPQNPRRLTVGVELRLP